MSLFPFPPTLLSGHKSSMERYREHSGRKERERARRGNKREGKEGSFLLSGGFLFTRVPGNFFVPSLARAQDFFRPMHKTVRSPRDNRLAKTRSLARLKDVGQKERERAENKGRFLLPQGDREEESRGKRTTAKVEVCYSSQSFRGNRTSEVHQRREYKEACHHH